ncbi:MAG: hypothetical protein UV05_C0009G0017 [candidate division CPR1 bacterium GW2011_GWA2_42_17]|uniref:Phosphoglycerate mutase n=1 Tax=candidate division CPR1 bacterium GW2011_GWA2_42_17 TaxID=1618341 RepID=A0A0G1C3L1_9BACT|nr:MAG: hypothetical protein UV05_C0009G0017 [candidate division CPR1 bacterium GW2011_GWA2_42_17]
MFETPVLLEKKEKFGCDVEILLKIIRHGDRDPKTNMLTDYGREETALRARESKLQGQNFDVIHAIGSTVGPYDEKGMGRAEATADIYAGEIAGDKSFNTRKSEALAFDKRKRPAPYNHHNVYNSFLPENFDALSPEQKAKAGVEAQGRLVEYVLTLNTLEALQFKEEEAGTIAYLIKHYQDVSHRLKSGKKALVPAGIHGPYMEYFLQEALIRKDGEGKKIRGFKKLSEIGGQHNVSEAFTVKIKTDKEGNGESLIITFDNPNRPQTQMELDSKVVADLAEKFEKLHPEMRGLREKKK